MQRGPSQQWANLCIDGRFEPRIANYVGVRQLQITYWLMESWRIYHLNGFYCLEVVSNLVCVDINNIIRHQYPKS